MPLFSAGSKLRASAENTTINTAGISLAAATDSTVSTTYVNLAATSSFSFTKYVGTGTAIRIDMSTSVKTTVAGDVVLFGVLINAVDSDVTGGQMDVANGAYYFSAPAIVQANLAAGTYTIQGRWKRVSGTGTLSRNTSHRLAIMATEVAV